MPTSVRKRSSTRRATRGHAKSATRAKSNGRNAPAKPGRAAAAVTAVTVAAKEFKDSAVKAGRKVNMRKAGPIAAAAVGAMVATGLFLRRKKK